MEWFLFGVALVVFILITGAQAARFQAEVRRLEQKVDTLSRKLETNNGKEQAWGHEPATNSPPIEMPTRDPIRSTWDIQQPFSQPDYPGFNSAGSKLSPEVRQFTRDKQKIQAIKLLREQTGLGLKEAKDMVDAYEQEIRQGY